jgi:hypothetical protein
VARLQPDWRKYHALQTLRRTNSRFPKSSGESPESAATEHLSPEVAPVLANPQMFASAQLPVIFIDKYNVSGIEMITGFQL